MLSSCKKTSRVAGSAVFISAGVLLGLAALEMGGRLEGVQMWVDASFGGMLGEEFSRQLPEWGIWGATGLVGVVLPVLVMQVACLWRRLLLWLACVVVLAAWAPVLVLAAYRPDVVLPCLAAAGSGGLAVLCAGRCGRRSDDAASDEAS